MPILPQQAKIQVYFLTDGKIVRDETITRDIWEAKRAYSQVKLKAELNQDSGKAVMRWTNGDVIKMEYVRSKPAPPPIQSEIEAFNKRFGNL